MRIYVMIDAYTFLIIPVTAKAFIEAIGSDLVEAFV